MDSKEIKAGTQVVIDRVAELGNLVGNGDFDQARHLAQELHDDGWIGKAMLDKVASIYYEITMVHGQIWDVVNDLEDKMVTQCPVCAGSGLDPAGEHYDGSASSMCERCSGTGRI